MGITIFISFLISFMASLLAAGYAVVRHHPAAKAFGWFAIGSNLMVIAGAIVAQGELAYFSPATVSIPSAMIPTVFSLFAIFLCRFSKGRPTSTDRHVSPMAVFCMVAVFGLLMSMCLCSGILLDFDLDP